LVEKTPPKPSTGVKSLDEKIAKRQLTLFDVYLAKQYLGMDVTQMGAGVEVSQKIANRTKATANIYDTLKGLEGGDNIIQKAQENAGRISGVKRWLNAKSGGVFGLSPELAQMDNAVNQYSYALARAMTSGKTTNQTIEDAKGLGDPKFRSVGEYTSRMGENQKILLNYLRQQMAELQALGGRVPEDVLRGYAKHAARAKFIDAHKGKIKVGEFDKIKE
ncbi:hypothetical protein, partial [Helicobacter vulpis]|uniref:hypothetical protein n=1 Tax=Helicobacter vulpis TaxID=2316076 RepID=UPI000EB1E7F5